MTSPRYFRVRTPVSARSLWRRATLVGSAIAVAVGVAGCGKSAVSQLRTNTPGEAAAKAMELYDANKDGKLSADEIQKCPAIADALPRIDANRNKVVDQGELEARFAAHDGMSQVVAFDISVTANRAPLVGAAVTYTPEPFMGEGKQSYVGTSTDGGACYVAGQEVKLPGVPTGFYKVHIVHTASGVDVTLGCEVADDSPSANRMAFDVKAAAGGGRG